MFKIFAPALAAALVVAPAGALAVSSPGAAGKGSASASSCSAGLLRLPRATRAGQSSLYGHVKSLTRKGSRFELRFDPAWLLTGVTASRAALEDTGSSDVSNDTYTVEGGHRLLTYLVPANAPVTVLTQGTCTTRSTVARLARAVPRAGFWIGVRGDTVRSLDQQYHP